MTEQRVVTVRCGCIHHFRAVHVSQRPSSRQTTRWYLHLAKSTVALVMLHVTARQFTTTMTDPWNQCRHTSQSFSAKYLSICLRCTADYAFPTRPAYRFLTEFPHLAVTLYSCWGTHHPDSCTRTLLCEQRSASPRATDEEEDRGQEHQPPRKGFEHEVVILHYLPCHNRSITCSQNNLSIQHHHCHVPCGAPVLRGPLIIQTRILRGNIISSSENRRRK